MQRVAVFVPSPSAQERTQTHTLASSHFLHPLEGRVRFYTEDDTDERTREEVLCDIVHKLFQDGGRIVDLGLESATVSGGVGGIDAVQKKIREEKEGKEGKVEVVKEEKMVTKLKELTEGKGEKEVENVEVVEEEGNQGECISGVYGRLLLIRAESLLRPDNDQSNLSHTATSTSTSTSIQSPSLSAPVSSIAPIISDGVHVQSSESNNDSNNDSNKGMGVTEVTDGLYSFLSAAVDSSLRYTQYVPFLALDPLERHKEQLNDNKKVHEHEKRNDNNNDNDNENNNGSSSSSRILELKVQREGAARNSNNEVVKKKDWRTYSCKNGQLAVLTLPDSSLLDNNSVSNSECGAASEVLCNSNSDNNNNESSSTNNNKNKKEYSNNSSDSKTKNKHFENSSNNNNDEDNNNNNNNPSRYDYTFSGLAVVSYDDVITATATALSSNTTQPNM